MSDDKCGNTPKHRTIRKYSTGRSAPGKRKTNCLVGGEKARPAAEKKSDTKSRVYIAAENRLLREALSRMLMKQGNT
jgi:hypothetical protein